MKELIKAFFVYGLTAGLSRFVSLLLIPIYTIYFTPTEYGVIDLIQSVLMMIMIFGILQLETSIQRYYYGVESEEKRNNASTIFLTVTALSIVLMIGVFLLSNQISLLLFNSLLYSYEIKIASVIIPLTNMSIVSFIVFRYMKKPLLFGVATLLQIIISAVSTIVFVVYLKIGILAVFYGQVLGLLVVNILQLIFLRNFYKLYWEYGVLKKMLQFALPQFPARIGSTSNVYINRFFILGFLSTSAIGIFSVGLKFSSLMQLFLSAFSMAWIPFMYETLDKENHKKIFVNVFKCVCILIFLLVVGLSFFSKEIIQMFTTPEYYEAYYLVGGLALYNGLFMVKEAVDLGPKITKKTIYITYTYLISSVANVIFLYLFVKSLGIYGAVLALVLTNLILVILSWYFSNKLYPIPYNKSFFLISFITMVIFVLFNMNINLNLYMKIFIYLFLLGVVGILIRKEITYFIYSIRKN